MNLNERWKKPTYSILEIGSLWTDRVNQLLESCLLWQCVARSPGGGGVHFRIRLVGDVPAFRVSIFNKNSRTGSKISVKIPEQVKFIIKALLVVKNSDLVHWFLQNRYVFFPKLFPEQGQKKFSRAGTSPSISIYCYPGPGPYAGL